MKEKAMRSNFLAFFVFAFPSEFGHVCIEDWWLISNIGVNL